MDIFGNFKDETSGSGLRKGSMQVQRASDGLRFKLKDLKYVATKKNAEKLLNSAYQTPITCIGVSAVWSNTGKDAVLGSKIIIQNPCNIEPLTLSLVLAHSPNQDEIVLSGYVVDLRQFKDLLFLEQLFRLPVPFVGYDIKQTLFVLWALKIQEPGHVWDIYIYEKASKLGMHHKKYMKVDEGKPKTMYDENNYRELCNQKYTLKTICHRNGVPYANDNAHNSINNNDGKRMNAKQIQLASTDAIVATKLYFKQTMDAIRNGTMSHLQTIEMPFVTTNAIIEWTGIKVDKKQATKMSIKYKKSISKTTSKLQSMGMKKPFDDDELIRFFKSKGILHLFNSNGVYDVKEKALKKNNDTHKSIPIILEFQSIKRRNTDVANLLHISERHGRVHSQFNQLGTVTGRISSILPNIMGLDRRLRHVVIPQKGYGIGSCDWSQKEVGLAAAIYNDKKLIHFFNKGDIYTAMAKKFYKKKLSVKDRHLSDVEFKEKYRHLRDNMKKCTLGIIYGMTPYGLAENLKCSEQEARNLLNKFKQLFPYLDHEMTCYAASAGIRGYASTITNLHRHRGKEGCVENWERRWLSNHPIQGTGAAIFKVTANRLNKLYKRYGARIIIPLHDEIIL